jgi:hypothetical protein
MNEVGISLKQSQASQALVRFRPRPPSESEKTPAFALGFLLLWVILLELFYEY